MVSHCKWLEPETYQHRKLFFSRSLFHSLPLLFFMFRKKKYSFGLISSFFASGANAAQTANSLIYGLKFLASLICLVSHALAVIFRSLSVASQTETYSLTSRWVAFRLLCVLFDDELPSLVMINITLQYVVDQNLIATQQRTHKLRKTVSLHNSPQIYKCLESVQRFKRIIFS